MNSMSNLSIDKTTNEKIKNKFFLFLVKSLFEKGFITRQEYDLLANNGVQN